MGSLPGVTWADHPYGAAQGAHLAVILAEWNECQALDLSQMAKKMAVARMADLRNIYAPDEVRAAGFEGYAGVGR